LLLGQSNLVLIENLPEASSHTQILDELLRNYPGVDKVSMVDSQAALVTFGSADSAKFAVMGLHRFKVDQAGR
jgi:hypothetical protein